MLRNLAAAVALILLSQTVFGLGLGTLKQSSALNEPFDGRIEILGATARDFDTILVKLADSGQFERAGIRRDAILLRLKFSVVNGTAGTDYIQISSHDLIREPFLNFLLELNWANGRMVREYTVLLDPPLYDPARYPAEVAPPAVPATPIANPEVIPESALETIVESVPIVRSIDPGPSSTNMAGMTFGPVASNDTLWSIASRNLPDDSTSVQQMMLALLRTNPEAFGSSNINILKRGAILHMPERSEIELLSRADAMEEVKRQHQLWIGYRDIATEHVTERPLGPDTGVEMEPMADEEVETLEAMADADLIVEAETDDPRLELVTPDVDEEQIGIGETPAGDAGITLAREELDAQVQENTELQARISEANEIIELMQRQVNIQDDELAALQARLEELGIEVPPDVAAELETRNLSDTDAVADNVPDAVAEMDGPDEEILADDAAMGDIDIAIGGEGEVTDDESMPVDSTNVPPDVREVEDAASTMGDGEGVAPEVDDGSLLGGLIPGHIANTVPGGAMTILGILGAVVLAIFVSLKRIRGRRKGDIGGLDTITAAATDEDTVSPKGFEEDDEPIMQTRDEGTEGLGAEDITDVAPEPQETSADFQQTLAAVSEELLPEEAEEDPLEEVNVYLAYERFDQAEELVRKVIGEHPDEHKYKLRLLEVFYSSNNQADYEKAAHTLHDAVGEDNPLWESAVAMWTEMSPDRALFEEGGGETAPPATGDDAKAFVDITAEDEAGGATMSMAPGSDAVLESTLIGLGDGPDNAESGSLDFDLGVSQGESENDEILDLTATTDSLGDDQVLDLTATTDSLGDDQVLDLTATADSLVDDQVLDLNATIDGEGILDLPTGMENTVGGQDDLLDITIGGGEPSPPTLLNDLLDVTKTGDLTEGRLDDILNVTSPGLIDEEEPVTDEESTAPSGDSSGVDFDISDTVSPAFDMEETEPVADDILDETVSSDEVGEEGTGILDFDIGDLVDSSELLDLEGETPNTSGGLDFDETLGEDFEFSIDQEDQDKVETVEMEAVDDEQANVDSMPLASSKPLTEEEPDLDLSLQSPELEEFSIEDDAVSGPELEPAPSTESEIEFDLALQDTTEMDSFVIDDTLELPKADESLEDLAKSMEESMADLDREDADFGDGDAETAVDFGLDTLDLETDTVAMDLSLEPDSLTGTASTVAMPADDDVQQQSDADEVDTKLNLAKAYIELGDSDGARSILDEVVRDGSQDQQSEAQRLIEQIG